MTIKISTTLRNWKADAFGDAMDSGYIEFRTGTQPANPQTAASGTLLLKFNFPAAAYGDAVTGVATAAAATVQTVTAAGTVGWARVFAGDDTVLLDCSVGTSGTDIIVSKTVWTTSDKLSLTSSTYTQPES